MKNVCYIVLLLGFNLFVFSETYLPIYNGNQLVNSKKILNNNFPVRETYPFNAIKIECDDTNLKVKISGAQLEAVSVVDIPDILFVYEKTTFYFPYQYFIKPCPMLLNVVAKKFDNLDCTWIVQIRTIDDGERGPKYERNSWFVLQYINESMVISDMVWSSDEESGYTKVKIDKFQYNGKTWYNIGQKKYTLKGKCLIQDLRFNSSNYRWINLLIDNTNVREEPRRNSKILTTLPAGTIVQTLEYAGVAEIIDDQISPWIKIQYNFNGVNVIGYIFGAYVK